MKQGTISLLSKLALLTAALIWGSTAFVLKTTLDSVPNAYTNAIRFTVGMLVLVIIFHKRLKDFTLEYWLHGGLMGIFLMLGYYGQAAGLMFTTPGKSAFLMASYCVMVPFLFWLIGGERQTRYNIIAAVLCVTGIGLVSFQGSLSMGKGDFLTLLGGLGMGFSIVFTAKYTRGKDPVLLSIVQFVYCAVIYWVVAFITETPPANLELPTVGSLLYLAVMGTALALVLQNVAQKYVDATASAIILSFEAVFGVIFSVIFYHEILTTKVLVGFVVMFAAMILAQSTPPEKNESTEASN